jgi:hypothetical protein
VLQCSKRRRPGTPQPAQPDGAGGRLMRHAVRRSNLLPLAEAAGPDGTGGASSRETGPKPQRWLPQEAPLFTRGSSHFLVSRGDPPDVRSLDGPQKAQARRHQGGPALLLEAKQAFRPRRIGRSHGGLGSPVPGWPVRVSAAAAVQENNVGKAFFLARLLPILAPRVPLRAARSRGRAAIASRSPLWLQGAARRAALCRRG